MTDFMFTLFVTATKAAKKIPSNIDEIKAEFCKMVDDKINSFHIPDSLVINWDQTGSILFFKIYY